MATRLTKVLDHLHQTLAAPGGEADGRLLGRFVATRDEAAFAALVRRHGPMVLGTCRRVLGHAQDAEDAFQATFLVLARRAAAVRRDTVAGWLHGVAQRVALEARTAALRRRARERQVSELPQPAVSPAEPQDWRPLLDRELARLREEYRSAVVLCDLEGRSRKEAARLLGVPEGTLSSRLARGRAVLARRLAKCGVTLSAAALSTLAREAHAAPAALAGETVRVGLLVAAGEAAASASVAGLTKEVLKAMFLGKLKAAAATAVVLAALGAGGLAWQAGGGRGVARATPQDNGSAVEAPRKARKPRQPIEEAEAAIKALREARDPQTRRRAAEALLNAARQLADQPGPGGRIAPAPEKYSFAMRDKPWAKVFEWLSEQTGKPVISPVKPAGTFTFIGPPGRKYTLPELIDILNESLLLDQKFILVNRPDSFVLLPADVNVDPSALPEVSPAELEKRGRTELVRMVLPVKFLKAGDLALEVQRLLGPFGRVMPLERANRLVLQDTAGNLRRALRVIQEVDAPKPGGREE